MRATGFQTIVREEIRLNVGENARIDFALSIGASQTTITVHDDHPPINTADASVGTVIDRNLIDQIPLNGGQIQTLVELSPGVTVVPVFDASRGQFVINGQRSDANYFTVDGVSANFSIANAHTLDFVHIALQTAGQAGGGMLPANKFLGTFSNLLSPEALEEFKIQTSTYAPEFGHLPGGQIALISRSRSTRYSGSLYEYFRNNATDANDWFNNAQGIPNPGLHFNNFGGTLSGPLRLARDSNGKDRTFSFCLWICCPYISPSRQPPNWYPLCPPGRMLHRHSPLCLMRIHFLLLFRTISCPVREGWRLCVIVLGP